MLVSMLALETRSSCYLFTKSWSKAGFSTGRLKAVNFIRHPASSIQLRYQLRQRQTSFYTSVFSAIPFKCGTSSEKAALQIATTELQVAWEAFGFLLQRAVQ